MRLDVTTIQRLSDRLVKAHLPPSACAHPKADLRVCLECGQVHCRSCHLECPCQVVPSELSEQWHKLCAFAMFKLGTPEVEITTEDIISFTAGLGENAGIVADLRGGRCILRLVTMEDAERFARRMAGQPT